MFWLIYLPLAISIFGSFISLIIDRRNAGDRIDYYFFVAIVVALVGLCINLLFSTLPTGKPTPDSENPVYLVKIPENDKAYLLLVESLDTGGKYNYYYLKDNVPQSDNIVFGKARLVFDNPEQPYYIKIGWKCENTFWLLFCSSPSPYTKEFHLPPDSVLKLQE